MSTARTAAGDDDAAALAAALREAPFVRLLASATGDAVAASGVLVGALRAVGTPFQLRCEPAPRAPATDDLVLTVGADGGDRTLSAPASPAAADVAAELGADPDRALALAGAVAAGLDPADGTLPTDLSREPGVATPTDAADGLAHTTLAHATFSGDPEAARAALSAVDDDGRSAASVLALDVAGAEWATPGAAAAVERALRPHVTPGGPFATAGGHADVLEAVAREAPGVAVALALGRESVRETALERWRDHARAVHAALNGATTGRYDGLFVARVDADDPARLGTAARLLSAFRSPEPVALVVGEGAAGVACDPDAGVAADATLAATRREFGGGDAPGVARATERLAETRFDGEIQQFIAALREVLP
jgi:hypothetical protein